MADQRINREPVIQAGNTCFKEAVCIDVERIYDSCADKDCLEDLRCYFTDRTQPIVDNATSVRVRKAEIITCFIDVEPVPFNRGFYTIDVTYFFRVTLDALTVPMVPPCTIQGLCVFEKKCILFGSDGNVKVFSSEFRPDENDDQLQPTTTNPRAVVQAVDPVALDAKICDLCDKCCDPCCCCVPKRVCCCFDGDFDGADNDAEKAVFVTLGLFSIIQLERDVQILVPAYDFCMPEKECACNTDDPCELFRKIKFPKEEFFPPELSKDQRGCCDKKDWD